MKLNDKTTFFIRWILTLILIFGSYRETGFYTALSLFLIFVAIEIQAFLNRKVRK